MKLPYYTMYPSDFDGDENVRAMDMEELGLYLLCLNHAWINGGIPDDIDELARVLKHPSGKIRKLWIRVQKCWQPNETPGRLVNARQEKERTKATDKRKKCSDAVGTRYGRSSDSVRPYDTPSTDVVPTKEDKSTNERIRASDSDSCFVFGGGAGEPDEIFGRVMKRHPKQAAPNYAETAFFEICSASDDPSKMALKLDKQHVKWCAHWKTSNTKSQFVPKLMDWLKGGDWKNEPQTTEANDDGYREPTPGQLM